MEIFIFIAAVVVIAGLVKALEASTPVHPRRGARALTATRPTPDGSTAPDPDTSNSFSALAMASHGQATVDHQRLDDHTRNTDSSTSRDAGAADCAPADSGSWDGGGDSGGGSDGGGCDSGGSG